MTMIRRLLSLAREASGAATIEFALLVPIMAALFCGALEGSQAVICYMKLVDAADTVADLSTQQKTLTSANVDDIYTAGQLVMLPSPGAGLGMILASVTFDPATGNAAVAWQKTRGGATALASATVIALATGLGNKGDSVIITRVNYTYTSLLKYVMKNSISMKADAMQRPRLVASIPYN
jgi:Flp pilus assembly protein TadG